MRLQATSCTSFALCTGTGRRHTCGTEGNCEDLRQSKERMCGMPARAVQNGASCAGALRATSCISCGFRAGKQIKQGHEHGSSIEIKGCYATAREPGRWSRVDGLATLVDQLRIARSFTEPSCKASRSSLQQCGRCCMCSC